MSLTARQDHAAFVLEKIKERLNIEVTFDDKSTAFHMGMQQERRNLLASIRHWEKNAYDPTRNTR